MNKRTRFWSQVKQQDKQKYDNEEMLFDWYFFRLIATYIAIIAAIAIFYSKTLAFLVTAILFTPCIIIYLILHFSKK